ncbi:MAG TPA: lipase maturation factor family protein [Bryobacteraceae bacterium]|nr:lipase maturation factor family protein [Bryobacteraceae bacterium]
MRQQSTLPSSPSSHSLACWLFLKILAVIYFIAFVSFGHQILGLIGSHGLLPIADYLRDAHNALGTAAYRDLPCIFWLDSSDAMLQAVAVAGAVFAISLFFNTARRITLVLLFILYLSLSSAGQTFMSFQWDALLLETGFLAIFLTAERWRVWLLWWLLFRLIFLSGSVKLLSHDPTWRSLTALDYHYWTQPLPTPIAWYMAQLPGWFQAMSVGFVFVVELGAPFLIFAGRRLRRVAAAAIASLQILILITGNYTFFNWLTLALCVLLIDDALWQRVLSARFAEHARRLFPVKAPSGIQRDITIALVIFVGTVSGAQLLETFLGVRPWPLSTIQNLIAPFQVVNTYGLFASMTTSRPEIIIEGSNDGSQWREYSFRYKPGDVKRSPPWVAPYQPRLDWQMWFAALGNYQQNPWFVSLMRHLLAGTPQVLALLQTDPFPGAPPRLIRAQLYDYHFTNFSERHTSGAWWRRTPVGMYFPAVSLSNR